MPPALGVAPRELEKEWRATPALKVCVMNGLTKKEVERAGTIVRHAITSVMKGKKWQVGRPGSAA